MDFYTSLFGTFYIPSGTDFYADSNGATFIKIGLQLTEL